MPSNFYTFQMRFIFVPFAFFVMDEIDSAKSFKFDSFDSEFISTFPGITTVKQASDFCKEESNCSDYQKVSFIYHIYE